MCRVAHLLALWLSPICISAVEFHNGPTLAAAERRLHFVAAAQCAYPLSRQGGGF